MSIHGRKVSKTMDDLGGGHFLIREIFLNEHGIHWMEERRLYETPPGYPQALQFLTDLGLDDAKQRIDRGQVVATCQCDWDECEGWQLVNPESLLRGDRIIINEWPEDLPAT